MENEANIMPFSDRRYEEVPIDLIKVINSRDRDSDQFKMNVTSISELGLMKPIRVNDKFLDRTGFYELICGEGRLLAHKELGKSSVLAEVVTCSRKEAYLQSLVENIARTKPGTMDFAREIKRLRDEGWEYTKIAKIACKSVEYTRQYIRLIEQGEERLIHAKFRELQQLLEMRMQAVFARSTPSNDAVASAKRSCLHVEGMQTPLRRVRVHHRSDEMAA